jgi:DNA-binding transcriptional LysR family regulator
VLGPSRCSSAARQSKTLCDARWLCTVLGVDAHLRDLRYFLAVAEELHFTRAAERLFISQPALSRQIAKLERDLRVSLLERDRRGVRLTPAGQALLTGIRTTLTSWDETRRAVSDAAAAAESVLRVGIQTSIGRGILAQLSQSLRRTHPNWTLSLTQVKWDDPTAGLADHSTDLGFLWLPLPDPDRFRWLLLASEPRYVALPVGHRLAKRRRVTLSDLADEQFIALPEQAGAQRAFWLAQDERAQDPKIAGVARSAEETFEAIAAGLGIALVAKGNARLYRQHAAVSRPVVDIGPACLALAWRSGDHREVLRSVVENVSPT